MSQHRRRNRRNRGLGNPASKGSSRKRKARFFLEALEERLAPTADLLIHAADSTPLTVRVSGGNVQVVDTADPAQVIGQMPASQIAHGVEVDAGTWDVQLTVDQTALQVGGGVVFDGGSGHSTLAGPTLDTTWHLTGQGAGDLFSPEQVAFRNVTNLLGAANNQDTFVLQPGGSISGLVDGGPGGYDTVVFNTPAKNVSYSVTGKQSGVVTLDGSPLRFDGMEPIVLTYPDGSVSVSSTDSSATLTVTALPAGATFNGQPVTMEVSSTAGETIEFNTPTSLTVDAEGTVNIDSLDPKFAGPLSISDASGTVNVTGTLVLASQPVTINAQTINVSGSIDVSGPRDSGGVAHGTAGSIALTGQSVTVDSQNSVSPAKLLAQGDYPGPIDIEVGASSSYTGPIVNWDVLSSSVTFGAASIKGGAVTVRATSDNTSGFAPTTPTSTTGTPVTFDDTALSLAGSYYGVSNALYLPGNGFASGEMLVYHSTGTPIGGLTDGTIYYAIIDSTKPDIVRLAASHSQALSDPAVWVALTAPASPNTGAVHSLQDTSQQAFGDSALNSADNALALPGSGFTNGQRLYYQTTGSPFGNLANDGFYYAIVDPSKLDEVQLAESPDDALANPPVPIKLSLPGSANTGLVHSLTDASVPISDSSESTVDVGQFFQNAYGFVSDALGVTSILAGLAVAKADASISIKAGTVIAAQSFVAHTTTNANAYVAPLGPGIGVAAGVIITHSTLTVDGSIATAGATTLEASTNHTINVAADASGMRGAAASVAVSVIDSNATVSVNDDATLNIGGDLIVQGDTVDANRTMARSTTGDDGTVGVSIAVGVETGNTNAFLDGRTTVGGDVYVTATQSNTSVDVTKLFILPGIGMGVGASAGVGSNSRGDLLDDAKMAAISKFPSWVADKVASKIQSKSKGTKNEEVVDEASRQISVGAGVGVYYDSNNTTAEIGSNVADGNPPVTNAAALVQAKGSVSVTASTGDAPYVSGGASVDSKSDSSTSSGGSGSSSPSSFAGSVGLAIGLFHNHSIAHIAPGSRVDAVGSISVTADNTNAIDPNSLWFGALVTPLLPSYNTATHTTGDGKVVVNPGDTVDVVSGFNGQGDIGARYTYQGTEPSSIDLSSANFGDTSLWAEDNPSSDMLQNWVTSATTFLDGALGLDFNGINNWTQATADGANYDVAGALTGLDYDNLADARIMAGAMVNQDAQSDDGTIVFTPGNQNVVVHAANVNMITSLVGNFQTLGISGPSSSTDSWSLKNVFNKPGLGTKNQDKNGKSAIGVGILVVYDEKNATAKIENGARVSADSLDVDASNEGVMVTMGASGGKANNVAFNGVFLVSVTTDTTLAQIDYGAQINVRSGDVVQTDSDGNPVDRKAALLVEAIDHSYIVTVAGGVAISSSVGIGASVAVNYLTRDTEAVVGEQLGDTSTAPLGSVTAGGQAVVHAENDGLVLAGAVSGAASSDKPSSSTGSQTQSSGLPDKAGTPSSTTDTSQLQTPDGKTASDTAGNAQSSPVQSVVNDVESGSSGGQQGESGGGATQGKAGIDVSGAVTVNIVDNDNAQAYIRNAGNLTFGTLTLKGENGTPVISLAGAVALALNSQGGSNTGIAGAVGVNIINGGTTSAFLDHATSLTASSFDALATRTGRLASLGAGVAVAKGDQGVGVAGSVGVSWVADTTRTGLANTTGHVSGQVTLNASDASNVILIAGSVGYGGRAGVGTAFGLTSIQNTVQSQLSNLYGANPGTPFTYEGDLQITASSSGLIVSVTGTAGVSSNNVGVGGVLSLNFIQNTVTAIANDSLLSNSTQSTGTGATQTPAATIQATDGSSIYAFAVGIGVGDNVGVGAAFALNLMQNTVTAAIENTTLTTTGPLEVLADETGITVVVAAGGAGGSGTAVAGAVAVNDTSNRVDAHITAASTAHPTPTNAVALKMGGLVVVGATDSLISVAIAGGGAGSSGTAAVGAGIAGNLLANTTTATVDDADITSTNQGITISASDNEVIVGVALGGAGADTFALGGSIVFNQSKNTVEAKVVDGSDLEAPGDITIAAGDASTVVTVAGSGAGSGTGAVGAAIGTAQAQDTVLAHVETSTVHSSTGSVSVLAGFAPPLTPFVLSDIPLGESGLTLPSTDGSQIVNVTLAGSGAGTFAVGGSIALNWIKNDVQAYLSGGAIADAASTLTVSAIDSPQIDSAAAGGAGAGTAAVGAAISYNFIGGDPGNPSRNIPAADSPADFTTSGAAQIVIRKGQTVEVGGQRYQYIQDVPLTITDFSKVNFNDTTTWQAVSPSTATYTVGTSSNPSSIQYGDSVDLPSQLPQGFAGKGSPGQRYEYMGQTPIDPTGSSSTVDLNSIDYTAAPWVAVASDTNADYSDSGGRVSVTISNGQTVDLLAGFNGSSSTVRYRYIGVASLYVTDFATEDFSNTNTWQKVTYDNTPGQVLAYIDGSAAKSSNGDVSVISNANPQIVNVTAGGAGAGTAAVSGSISINFIHDIEHAEIRNGSVVTAQDNLDVQASAQPAMIIIAGNGAGAGTVAVGASIATNDMQSEIHAIVSDSSVTAMTGNLTVHAGIEQPDSLPNPEPANFTADGRNLTQPDTVTKGQTVDIVDGYASTNANDLTVAPGQRFLYIGSNPLTVWNYDSVDFSDTSQWKAIVNKPDAQIWAFAVSGQGAGTAAVAGSIALNWIRNDIEARIENISSPGAVVQAGQALTVSAVDGSSIDALAGAVSGAGVAAVGASVSYNYLGGDPADPTSTRNNIVKAGIEDVTVPITAGSVSVTAEYTGQIRSLTVGGAGAGLFALGGAVSINVIHNSADAHIVSASNLKTVTQATASSNVEVSAHDSATIQAMAGGLALAIGLGGPGVSIGISVAENKLGDTTHATIGRSTINSAGSVGVAANAVGTIQALTIGGAGAVSTGTGIAFAGAGAGSGNSISNSIVATIDDNSHVVTPATFSTSGGPAQPATIQPGNTVDLLPGFIGSGKVATRYLYVGTQSIAVTDLKTVNFLDAARWRSLNAPARYSTDGSPLTVTVKPGDTVDVTTGFVGNGTSGERYTYHGSSPLVVSNFDLVDFNTSSWSDNGTSTSLGGTATFTADGTPPGSLTLEPADTIDVQAGFAGKGIVGERYRYIGQPLTVHDFNTLDFTDTTLWRMLPVAGSVQVIATDSPTIEAASGALAVAVGVGAGSLTASFGVSIANNTISDTVRATIDGSTVGTTTGDIVLSATSGASIQAVTVSGSASVGVGVVAGAAAGVGAGSNNAITDTVQAAITSGGSASTTDGGSIEIGANDTSQMTADAGGLAVAAAAGLVGGTAALGVSASTNSIQNTVQAYIGDPSGSSKLAATASTWGGDILLAAREAATIQAWTLTGSVAITASAGGGSVAAAGSGAGNTVTNTVEAFANAGSILTTSGSGNVVLSAIDDATINSFNFAGSVSVADGLAVALGASGSVNTISDTVEAFSAAAAITSAGDLTLTALVQSSITSLTIAATASVGGGGVSISGAGAGSTNTITNTVASYLSAPAAVTSVPSTPTPGVYTAAGNITLVAIEAATTDAEVGSGALSVGSIGGSVGISVALSTDTSSVKAYARNAWLETASSPTYTVSGKPLTVTYGPGQTVDVAQGYTGAKGTVGQRYEYIGRATLIGDLNAADFSDTTQWRPVGAITISATAVDTVVENLAVATSIALALGGAGAGAGSTTVISPTVDASADSGSTLHAAGSVTLAANTASAAQATTFGAAGGLVALGGSAATAVSNGTVTAHLDGSVSRSESVAILATTTNSATALATALAGGIVAGSGAVTEATTAPFSSAAIGTYSSKVSAYTGTSAQITASNDATIQAVSQPAASASSLGVDVGSAALGASVALANTGGTVDAHAGDYTQFDTDSLVISAIQTPLGFPTKNLTPTAQAQAVGGAGGLVGAEATDAEANASGTVSASTGFAVSLPDGAVAITATNQTYQKATGTSVGAGFIGLGAGVTIAGAAVTTSATLGSLPGTSSSRAGSLTILATGLDNNESSSTAGSGGVAAGDAATATTNDTSAASATIAGGSNNQSSTINTGTLALASSQESDYAATADSTQAAAAGASGAFAVNTDTTSAETEIGPYTRITANGPVAVTATNVLAQTGGGVDAGSGGILNGTAAVSLATLNGTATVTLGDDVAIASGTDRVQNPGGITLEAVDVLTTADSVTLSTGGVIEGAGVNSTVNGTLNNSVTVGQSDSLTSHGNVGIGSYADIQADASSNVSTQGVAGVGVAQASSTVTSSQDVHLGTSVTILADKNVNITAGNDPNGLHHTTMGGTASAQGYVRGLIAIPDATATSSLTSNASLEIDSGSSIQSGLNTVIGAYPGTPGPVADGTGHGYELGDIPATDGTSTPTSSTTSTVTMNGTIVAGIYHSLSVKILPDTSQPHGINQTPVITASHTPALPFTHTYLSSYDPSTFLSGFTGVGSDLLASNISASPVAAFLLDGLYAAPGNVTVNADSLSGAGKITAYGDATISIDNESPAYLLLGSARIENVVGGQVNFTGKAQASSLTIVDNPNATPAIIIKNGYTGGVGTDATGAALSSGPAILQTGNLENLRGLISITNARGSYATTGQTFAQQLVISVPNGVVVVEIPSPGVFYAGETPYSEWQNSGQVLPGGSGFNPNLAIAYVANAVIQNNLISNRYAYWLQTSNLLYSGAGQEFIQSAALNLALYESPGMKPPNNRSYVFLGDSIPWYSGDGTAGTASSYLPPPNNLYVTFASANETNPWHFPWIPYEDLQIQAQHSTSAQTSQNTSSISAQDLAIKAQTIDLSGTVNAGSSTHWSITLNPELATVLNKFQSQYDRSVSDPRHRQIDPVFQFTIPRAPGTDPNSFQTSASGDSLINASYDARTKQIALDPIDASSQGGFVQLDGAIIATNTLGNIHVESGFGQVSVDNQSGIPLVVNDVFTGSASSLSQLASRVDIIDRNTLGQSPSQTLYVHIPGQARTQVYSGSVDTPYQDLESSSTATKVKNPTYTPAAGLRWQWTETASLSRKAEKPQGGKTLQLTDWTWNLPDPTSNNPWQYLDPNNNNAPTSTPVGSLILDSTNTANDFIEQISGSLTFDFLQVVHYRGGSYQGYGEHGFYMTNQAGTADSQGSVDKDSNPYGEWDYYYPESASLTLISSAKADNPIGIDFSGESRGTVTITSNAAVLVQGNITNPNGDTTITTTAAGGITEATDSGQTVTTNSLTLNSARGIGTSDQPFVASLVENHPAPTQNQHLTATGRTQGVYLNLGSGAVLDRVASVGLTGIHGDVVITAAGDLTAGTGAVNIEGRNITVDSSAGGFGTDATPIVIAAIPNVNATTQRRIGGIVNIQVADAIHIQNGSTAGDLLVGQIVSINRDDITISNPAGSVLDARNETATQALSQDQLTQIWNELHLLGADAQQNAQNSVTAFQNLLRTNYDLYQNLLAEGSVTGGLYSPSASALGSQLVLVAWGNGSVVPTSGSSVVYVGFDSKNLLNVRSFDAQGKRRDWIQPLKPSQVQSPLLAELQPQISTLGTLLNQKPPLSVDQLNQVIELRTQVLQNVSGLIGVRLASGLFRDQASTPSNPNPSNSDVTGYANGLYQSLVKFFDINESSDYWLILAAGSIQGGKYTVDADVDPTLKAVLFGAAATELSVTSPSLAQVEQWAASRYAQIVADTNPDRSWQSAGVSFVATGNQTTALTKNAVWTQGQLTQAISAIALTSASGTPVGNATPNIIGHNVTITAKGGVGKIDAPLFLDVKTLQAGDLTPNQAAALALAQAPGDAKLVSPDPSGNFTQVEIQQTEPLFVEASGTFDATAGGSLFVQGAGRPDLTLGRVGALGDAKITSPGSLLAGPNSLVATQGNLTLLAGAGSIGTQSAPLAVAVAGTLAAADAATDMYLDASQGDLTIGQISGSGTVSLVAYGSITGSTSVPPAVQGTCVLLHAIGGSVPGNPLAGRIGSTATPIAVSLLTGGSLTATAADSIDLSGSASDPSFNAASLASLSGDITLSTSGSVLVGSIEANNGTVGLTAHGSIDAAIPGPYLVNIQARDLNLSAIKGAIGSELIPLEISIGSTISALASGDIWITQPFGDMKVVAIASTSGNVNLSAGGSILAAEPGTTPVIGGTNLSLIGETGTIGTAAQDLYVVATGSISAGAVGDIHLTQASGDLGLASAVSLNGNIDVTAAAGSLTLLPLGLVEAYSGSATLSARNDLTLSATSHAIAVTGFTLNADFGNPQTGPCSTINVDTGIVASNVMINGGPADDTLNLQATAENAPVLVSLGDGNNGIQVGSAAPAYLGTLGQILGPIAIEGQGHDSLSIDDSGDSTGQTGILTGSTLTGLGMAGTGITYSGVSFLTISLGSGSDTLNVQSTATGTATVVYTGLGFNTLNLGSLEPVAGGTIAGIQGYLDLNGIGFDTINVDNTGTTTTATETLTASHLFIQGMGLGGVDFSGNAKLNIALGSGNNTFALNVSGTTHLPPSTTITAGAATADSLTATFANDFDGGLQLANFESANVSIGGNFDGFLADRAGPIGTITVGGSITSIGSLLVQNSADPQATQSSAGLLGNIGTLTVGGNLAGSVAVRGNIATLNIGPADCTRGGLNDLSGSVVANGAITTASIAGNLSGKLQESLTINSLTIGGAITSTGSVLAVNSKDPKTPTSSSGLLGNINTLTVGSGIAGKVVVSGNLGSLALTPNDCTVGAASNLSGQVQVGGAIGTATVANNVSGQIQAGLPVQNILVGGSITSTGSVSVVNPNDPQHPTTSTGLLGSITVLTVGGGIAGTVTTTGNIGTLTVGTPNTATTGGVNNVTGQVQVGGAVSTVSVSGDVTGSITETLTSNSVYVGGSITSTGSITAANSADPKIPTSPTSLLGNITVLTVGGGIAGTVTTTGNIGTLTVGTPNTPTTGGVNNVSGQVQVGGALTGVSVSGNVSGSITESLTVNSVYVGGSLTSTGSINAVNTVNPALGNINGLTITGPTAGVVNVSGTLGSLGVNGSVGSGSTITVSNLPNLTIGGDLAGNLVVTGTLQNLTVKGATPGTIQAAHVGTISVGKATGPVVSQITEGGITRRIEAVAAGGACLASASNLPGITFAYIYEGSASALAPAQPQATIRVINASGSSAPDQFDLSLVSYNDTAKYNLARLDATGVSGIRNVAIEGDLLTRVSPAAASVLPALTTNEPAGVNLPLDKLAGVAVRDFAPTGAINARTIQAVAFGSTTGCRGSITTGAAATEDQAAALLSPATAIVQAGSTNGTGAETFRVPFADQKSQQVGFFLATSPGGRAFDNNDIALTVQSVDNGLTSSPSNAARGAVVALIGVQETTGCKGTPGNTVVQTLCLCGDGGSINSNQFIAQSITSTGTLGDVTVNSSQGIHNITAASFFGSISTCGPIFGTLRSTGQRTDPITGAVSSIAGDFGRAFVAASPCRGNPSIASTTISGNLTGSVISAGNLISSICDVSNASVIAAGGNIGIASTLLSTTAPTRVGGLGSFGPFSGSIVALGSIVGDMQFNGGLRGGRIAARGGIAGNVTINGRIDGASALVSGGEIGDPGYKTTLWVSNNAGIIAAKGAIAFASNHTNPGGSVFNNVGTAGLNAAAIDAIFTDASNAPLDITRIDKIVANLAALKVDSTGHLTVPKKS